MFLQELSSKKQRLLQIVRMLRENHQFDFPLQDLDELIKLDEHFSGVQRQIQEKSAFNSYHADPLYAKAVLITEAVRLLFEISPRRRKKKSVKESATQQEPSMTTLSEKAGKKAKPDFLDIDKDGNKKETFKKAVADKKKADQLDEKWGTAMHTAAKDVGKWDGYTIAELKARKKKLMDKEERSAAEQKEVRQINFAIRAKQEDSFGKIKESATKQKLREDETLDKAETLLAAKDISDRLQGMAEDAAKMAVDRLMPLVDTMKSQFGQPAAEGFNEVVKSQLQSVLDTIIAAKDQTDNAILALQGGQTPSMASDMSAEIPAAPAGAPEMPAAPEAGADVDFEKEFAATPAASGPEEEPLGRSRKEPVAEARQKCMECMEGIMEKKNGRMVCNECGYSMIAEKLTKNMTAGQVISDFVHSDDPKFKGKERTQMALGAYYGMHPEKSKMEEQALAEQTKIVRTLANQYKKLDESFQAHKREFANNSNRIDPLNLGYGLEGDSIRIQLRSVRQELDEAVAKANTIRQTIQEQNELRQQTAAKIEKLNEQAQSSACGVLAITNNNRKVKKFFESAQHREMWLDYNKNQILEHRLIDAQDVLKAQEKLRRTLGK